MRWAWGLLLLTCAPAPEVRSERHVIPAADAGPPGGSAMDPTPPITTPSYGSVLVILRTAEGQEYTIICGGDVSLSAPDGRKLLRLDRQPGGMDRDSGGNGPPEAARR